ncbi:hypothetical protein BS78_03G068800, partial [Paspalum vaginatum]
ALDLNSQAEEFPDLSVYSRILEGTGGSGPQPTGGATGGGGHGASMSAGAAGGGGRGGSLGAGAAGGRSHGGSMAGSAAGGRSRGGSLGASAAGGRGRGGSMSVGTAGAGGGGVGEYTINLDDEEVEAVADEGFVQGSQNKPKCKKPKWGATEYLDELHEMFHDILVDGFTSYIPGQEEFSNSRKRSSSHSTRSSAISPSKKSKSPMVNMMKQWMDNWSCAKEETNKILKQRLQDKLAKKNNPASSVKKCQELALECEAAPDSIEFFACAQIFREEYKREFFSNIPTPEARMVFLKRWCQAQN